MKKFTITVDMYETLTYCTTVEVEAEDANDAYSKASDLARNEVYEGKIDSDSSGLQIDDYTIYSEEELDDEDEEIEEIEDKQYQETKDLIPSSI